MRTVDASFDRGTHMSRGQNAARAAASPARFFGIILGIALVLLVRDARRIYVVSLDYASQSIAQGLNMFIAAALFAALAALCYLHPRVTLSSKKATGIAASIALSFSTLLIYLPDRSFMTQFSPIAMLLVYSLSTFCSFLLLVIWMERASGLKMREWFLILGCALLCSAGLELATICLRTTAAVGALVLAPLVSLALLMRASRDGESAETQPSVGEVRLGKHSLASTAITVLLFFFVVALANNSQYSIEHASLALGANEMLMQVSYETGIAIAGAALCLTATCFWSRGVARYIPLLIPACFGVIYMVSNIGGGTVAFLALSPLALMLKLSYVLPLLFFQTMRERFTFAACIVSMVALVGCVLGAAPLFRNAVDPESVGYGLVITLLLSALLALSFVLILLNPNSGKGEGSAVAPSAPEGVSLKEQAVSIVAARHRLTPRETEILSYLADGWRSSSIAEKTVLSQTTVKNHMGRIYKKLDVHSQQEILAIVDEMVSRLASQAAPSSAPETCHEVPGITS